MSATQQSISSAARAKAKQSCYDQIFWIGRDGERHTDRVTVGSVKAAMLAMGTGGSFTIYSARSCVPLKMNWRLATACLANLKSGFYAHG